MACMLCKNLKKNEDDFRLAFEFTPSELLKSAEDTKCVACKLLLDGLLCFEEDSWKFSKDITRVYAHGLTKEQHDTLSIEVYFTDDRPKLVLEFYNKQGKDASSDVGINWQAIRPRTSISGHALSPEAMNWLTTRLEVCERNHLCQRQSATILPKRTLSFQKSIDGRIEVRLFEGDMQEGRYVALSHCWGSAQHCVLTSETLPAFKSSIPWYTLPKTFQDAIIFSTKLDVYHIWIDALCIIQDDHTDWEIESAKMADIYQDSYLTLAATGSSSDMSGCFASGEPAAATSAEYELSVPRSSLHSHYIMVRKKVEHWTWPLSKASANSHPLLSRGWAFQERILSPRLLHFCKEELVWECRRETLCECGSLSELPEMKKDFFVAQSPEELEPSALRPSISMPMSEAFSGVNTDGTAEGTGDLSAATAASTVNRAVARDISVQDAAENWHRIIEQYSALKLTIQTDRLPALSGLAIRSSPVLLKYLAGLWKENIVSDLMWRVNLLEAGIGRAGQYVGPSWSWISITGPVSYWTEAKNEVPESFQLNALHRLLNRVRVTSFSADVNISSTNPYGRIHSGTLIVDGYLKPARLLWVSTRTGGTWGNVAVKEEPVPLKYELEINPAGTSNDQYLELPFFADYVLREGGQHYIPDKGSLNLLLLHPSICLVLRSVAGKAWTYRRVGIVRQPWEQISIYGIDWMSGSLFRKRIQII